MSYTAHTWTNGETITAAKMNNLEEGIAEAAQSGGGYDLIIRLSNIADAGDFSDSDISLVSGSYLDAMEKIANGGFITAAVYYYYFQSASEYGYCLYPVEKIIADVGYHDCIELGFLTPYYMPQASARNAGDSGIVTLFGASDSYRWLYITESGVSLTAPWN